ncbi:hypothetical protein [Rubrivirga sp. IMCC45206]|uniref:hypothetical protein n=1 Tax=Rubrivirga sp. IMCC45206 TaxID=3391614 RepID=UPI00398FAB7C
MRRLATLCLGLLAALAACEVPFDPIVPSDLVFSFSGYLDASADTQVVRVEPVARTAEGEPGRIDAEVTLTDLDSGARVVLAQDVRTFPTGPAHLFRTAAPIVPGGRYRLVARRSDGAESATDVEVPEDDAYSIAVETGRETCPTSVVITGAERVVDVQARYRIFQDGQIVERRYSHAGTFERLDDGSLRAKIYYADDAAAMGLDPLSLADVISSDLVVAVSTSAWPDPVGLSLEDILQIGSVGVDNGLGFVGGAITERRPFVPGIIKLGFGPTAQTLPCTAR